MTDGDRERPQTPPPPVRKTAGPVLSRQRAAGFGIVGQVVKQCADG